MTLWLIEPRDPLIVRDGRPFGPNPGARASSLEFPFPATIAGGVRTRAGLGGKEFKGWDENLIKAVKKIGIRGPWLVQLDEVGNLQNHLLPSPADCIVFPFPAPRNEDAPTTETKAVQDEDKSTDSEKAIYGKRALLVPIKDDTVFTNLPDGLWPVQLQMDNPGKPEERVPRYWNWATLFTWLLKPKPDVEPVAVKVWGSAGPTREARTHVSLGRETLTAVDGQLFQTSGLEFTRSSNPYPSLCNERLALAVEVDESEAAAQSLVKVLAPFGGERRLVQWRKATLGEESPAIPDTCPQEISSAILEDKRCRVVLVTPAHFTEGYLPTKLCTSHNGLTVTLKGAAVRRAQTVSGWDLAAKNAKGRLGQPKATRRLAPAGSVYWLSFEGSDEAQIQAWINAVWMKCISDEDASCKDGFGLALLGTWTTAAGGNNE